MGNAQGREEGEWHEDYSGLRINVEMDHQKRKRLLRYHGKVFGERKQRSLRFSNTALRAKSKGLEYLPSIRYVKSIIKPARERKRLGGAKVLLRAICRCLIDASWGLIFTLIMFVLSYFSDLSWFMLMILRIKFPQTTPSPMEATRGGKTGCCG